MALSEKDLSAQGTLCKKLRAFHYGSSEVFTTPVFDHAKIPSEMNFADGPE
jgi:hypothetical protein